MHLMLPFFACVLTFLNFFHFRSERSFSRTGKFLKVILSTLEVITFLSFLINRRVIQEIRPVEETIISQVSTSKQVKPSSVNFRKPATDSQQQ